MNFSRMCNDIITLIKPDGTIIENIKALVQPKIIFISDEKLPLEENDKIYRKLPNGLIETYIVLDRGYYSTFHSMKGHYQAKVRKEGSINNEKYQSIINVYNANGKNSKINVNSIDNSVNYNDSTSLFVEIKEVLEKITDVEVKEESLKIMQELKSSQHTHSYLCKYQKFISVLSNHITLIAPFIPALTELIK